jgi:dimethylglycine catabolism B
MAKNTKLTPPGHAFVAENIRQRNNVLGAAPETRAAWAKGIHFNPDNTRIFFSGCGYQYGSQVECLGGLLRTLDRSVIGAELPQQFGGLAQIFGFNPALIYTKLFARRRDEGAPLRAAVKVLQALGYDLGYLGAAEPCCGALMHFMGHQEDFTANARRVYQTLHEAGVKEIVSIVPSCTHALRELIPAVVPEWDITVKHFSEVVADKMATRRWRSPEPVKVTYHDPCQLGRFLGVTAAPRDILNAIEGVEFVEPEHAKGEMSTCCGGGAGFETVFPELSEILAANRAREMVETGAEVIVTQCPGCIAQLVEGLKKISRPDVRVLDLAEIAALSLEAD